MTVTAEEVTAANDKLADYLKGPVFAEVCARAKLLSKEMRDATEDLNDALSEAERVMVHRFKGHAAAIEFDDRFALLFWHFKGRWGLYVLDDTAHLTPLLNAPRQRRVEAASLLLDLAVQLQTEVES